MRSEREGVAGSGAAAAARGPNGREKLAAAEAQFRRESPRREPDAPPAPSPGRGSGADKPREEKRTALSKVVIRRLPPGLTKAQLEAQLRPLPAHDYFEFFAADFSLYPHLYSRAYINFRNPDDILLFRDRFDGYIFIDSKGLEYPAVVEFAPFQKVARKKPKKDARTGSIEDDPEYKKFLETYCVEEEKTSANPETLLGDIEAKTRDLIGPWKTKPLTPPLAVASSMSTERPWARRTTPLLEYIKSRRLEKQRMREEKREERRRRDLEKKRLREEEKRRRREEDRCKRKEADRRKKAAEKHVRIKLLKKPETGEEPATEKPKGRGEEADAGEGRREPPAGHAPPRPEGPPQELLQRPQDDGGQEPVDVERGLREDDPEAPQGRPGEGRGAGARHELGRSWRRSEDSLKWGRGPKGSQEHGAPVEVAQRPGREKDEDGPAPRKELVGDKDRPAGQLRQPGPRGRACEEGGVAEVESE